MKLTTLTALAAAALLSACAGTPVAPPAAEATAAPAWQAPLPAGAAGSLAGWWARFDDPVLVPLIEAAQAASPTLSDAANRIAQARAQRVAAGAVLGPQAGATASASRGRTDGTLGAATTTSAGLQASWELDLFGGNRAGRDAAQARLEASQADWHAARTAVAAEAATGYVELRACEAQLEQTSADATSRGETARLTELAERAGLRAPADAALARASAAQGRALATQQRAQCDLLVKSLVALTAWNEGELRQRLAATPGRLPAAAPIAPTSVPAVLLQQRPDLASARRAVAAAAADSVQRQAAMLPQVSLTGSVGGLRVSTGAGTASGTTWSIGPLSVTVPLFDGGSRAEATAAARAAYDDAVVQLQARVRTAVREVEESLVRLDASNRRLADARTAAEGFEASLKATEARWRGGLASLFELEDARRSAVAARSALIDLDRERLAAWITLYRALGGGWDESTLAAAPDTK